MARPPRPSERRRQLDDDALLLGRLARDWLALDARMREFSASPISSGGGGPAPKGTVSDPTGNAALGTDEHGAARRRLAAILARIHIDVRAAEAIRHEYMAPPVTADQAAAELTNQRAGTLQPCANAHGCPDEAWASKAGRCEACYRHHHRNGRDRRLSGQPRGTRRSGEPRDQGEHQ